MKKTRLINAWRRDVHPTTVEPLLDSREAAALLKMHHKTLERKAGAREVHGFEIACNAAIQGLRTSHMPAAVS